MRTRPIHWPSAIAWFVAGAIVLFLTVYNLVQFPIAAVRHWVGWS